MKTLEKFKDALLRSGKPKAQVAKVAGIHRNEIYLILRGERSPKIETWIALFRAVGYETEIRIYPIGWRGDYTQIL